MARVKSPYAEPMFNAGVQRLVGPGEVVDIPDGDLPSYLEAGWQPGDKDTKALAEKLRKEAEAAEQQGEGEQAAPSGEEQPR